MEVLTKLKQTSTISSLDISRLTRKRHDHVMRDIHNMLNSLEIDIPKFGDSYLDSTNRRQKCFNLPKRESLILASGYDVVLRASIIDRWEELESANFSIPQTYSDALRSLADSKEQEEKALLQLSYAKNIIEENKSKVTFAETVVGSHNSILIRQFAKDLCDDNFNIGEKRLFVWFRENKYLMRNNSPYQNYVDMGLFDVITRVIGGSLATHTIKTTKITGKGMIYFTIKIKKNLTNGDN